MKLKLKQKSVLFLIGLIIGTILSLYILIELIKNWPDGVSNSPYRVVYSDGGLVISIILTAIAVIAMPRFKKQWLYPLAGFGVGWHTGILIYGFLVLITLAGT